jgi:hypothetical protein
LGENDMEAIIHKIHDTEIVEILSDKIIIQKAEDALSIMGDYYFQGFDHLIFHQNGITDDFFDLKNGLAGEILQKFSTYRMKLAIVGDFSRFTSKSVYEFIFESNKGKQIIFVDSVASAIDIFGE